MPPPASLAPLPLGRRRAVAHQALHRNDLPEPLLGRLCKEATPAPVGRNVILDRAHRRDLCPVADAKMVVDTDLWTQRHIVANRQAARESYLGRQQTMPADGNIVDDLDLIVD